MDTERNNYASKGVAGTALGLGIGALGVEVLRGGLNGILGGNATPAATTVSNEALIAAVMAAAASGNRGSCNEDHTVNRYEAAKDARIAELETEVKLRDAKTLRETVDEYINARRDQRSPATIAGYEKDARNLFQAAMGWNVYTTSDEQWQKAIKEERKKGRSAKYIQNGWSLMAASIEAATGRRPQVILYPNESEERKWLDWQQIDVFVAAVKGKPVEIPALLCLSSLRRSELLSVKWSNVDFAKKCIKIQGATVRGSSGLVEKKQNKTDKSRRVIPIIPPLLEALESAERKSDKVVTMGGDTALKQVNKICRENGLPEVGLHGLRHSFASLAYHLGIPEMIAAEIGGWDDLGTMHKIYTHMAKADIAKRSQDFMDYFDPEKRPELETKLETDFKK